MDKSERTCSRIPRTIMPVKKDNYTPLERKEYNRHYYPHNKERMQEQRRTPMAVHRRKLNRVRHRYEAQIAKLLEKMAVDIALLHDELKLAQEAAEAKKTA